MKPEDKAEFEKWKKTFREAPDSTKLEVSILMAFRLCEGLPPEMTKDVLIAALDAHRSVCILEGIADILEKDSTSPYPLEIIMATYGIKHHDRGMEKKKLFARLFENVRIQKEKKANQ